MLRVTVLIALEPLRAEAAALGTVLAVTVVPSERMVITALFGVFKEHLEYFQGKC